MIIQPACSRQGIQSNRKRNREKAKCYRDKVILEKKLETAQRRVEMLGKQLRRPKTVDSPKSKTRQRLRYVLRRDDNGVRKTLIFHYAVIKQLKEKYKKSTNTSKRIITDAIIGNVTRKYKYISHLRRELGMKCNTTRHRKNGSKFSRMRNVAHTFFERDDNSRMTTGLKQTITKQKEKRQTRFMLDILRNVYMKYESENNERISFTTFWRLKPFWIKCPTENERETCLCKTCENLSFMVKVLFK